MSNDKFGIPVSTKPGLLMPWYSYRFKVASRFPGVTQNVEDVSIDFKNNTVKISVRATVDPEHYLDAIRFGSYGSFKLDCMTGGDDNHFSLIPRGLKLTSHDFGLDYAVSKPAHHQYTFTFEDMGVQAPEAKMTPAPLPIDDDGFMTPAEALKSLAEKEAEKKGLTGGRQLLNEDDDHCPRDAGC